MRISGSALGMPAATAVLLTALLPSGSSAFLQENWTSSPRLRSKISKGKRHAQPSVQFFSLLSPSLRLLSPSSHPQLWHELVQSSQLVRAAARLQGVRLESSSTGVFTQKHCIPSRQLMLHTEPHIYFLFYFIFNTGGFTISFFYFSLGWTDIVGFVSWLAWLMTGVGEHNTHGASSHREEFTACTHLQVPICITLGLTAEKSFRQLQCSTCIYTHHHSHGNILHVHTHSLPLFVMIFSLICSRGWFL